MHGGHEKVGILYSVKYRRRRVMRQCDRTTGCAVGTTARLAATANASATVYIYITANKNSIPKPGKEDRHKINSESCM